MDLHRFPQTKSAEDKTLMLKRKTEHLKNAGIAGREKLNNEFVF